MPFFFIGLVLSFNYVTLRSLFAVHHARRHPGYHLMGYDERNINLMAFLHGLLCFGMNVLLGAVIARLLNLV